MFSINNYVGDHPEIFECECEYPEIQVISYRERPICLIIPKGQGPYTGPKTKMVPIKRCVICGGLPRFSRCLECSMYRYKNDNFGNDYCYSCKTSNDLLFEKARTLAEGRDMEIQLWNEDS